MLWVARMIAVMAVVWLCAGPNTASAERWCGGAYPGAIFCDDFDRNCPAPPEIPGACPDGSLADDLALQTAWPVIPTDANCRALVVETQTATLSSSPFGAKLINGGNNPGNYLGQSSVDLTNLIRSKSNNQYDLVNGTDAQPLVLRFEMGDGPVGNSLMGYQTGYLELARNDDYAPMDYIRVGWDEGNGCESCFQYCFAKEGIKNNGVHVAWPTICQSYSARTNPPFPNPHCPPAQNNTRMAVAIGAVAMLDNIPCHCGSTEHMPNNWQLSFYDGWKWRMLQAGIFPGNGGNFALGPGYNTVVLIIKTNTVDIYHRAMNFEGTAWVESTATEVPRLYAGGFNKLRLGAAAGCSLNNGSYSCSGPRQCLQMGDVRCDNGTWQRNKSTLIDFDSVALYGGPISSALGACCREEATCVQAFESDCALLGGHFRGQGTTCAAVSCCPSPFADGDGDGDVDQGDFGILQRCYTESPPPASPACACFDRDADADVDEDDFTAFIQCWTGPGVPFVPTPGCSP